MNTRMKPTLALAITTASLLLTAPSEARGYESSETKEAALHDWPAGRSVVDTIRRRGLLKVGMSLFEPWVMCSADGELIGYEVDIARQLADDMGVRVQFVRTDWYYILPALIEEEFDLVVSGMGITPARGLLVNFTIPYSEFGTAVVANRARTVGLETPDGFDNADMVFGARAGTVPAQAAADHFRQATLRTFDTDADLLGALLAGEVHAAAVDQVKATRWLDAHTGALRRPFAELFNRVPEGIALRKGDADGANFLNGWIAHHRTSGWLAERRAHWFDTRDWNDQVAVDPATVAQCEASFEANPY